MTCKSTVVLAIVLASGSIALACGKKHYRPIDNGCRNGQSITEEGRRALRIRQDCKQYTVIVDQAMRNEETREGKLAVYDVCMQQGTAWDHPRHHKIFKRALNFHLQPEPRKSKAYTTIAGTQKLSLRECYAYFINMVTIDLKNATRREDQQCVYNQYENNTDYWVHHPLLLK